MSNKITSTSLVSGVIAALAALSAALTAGGIGWDTLAVVIAAFFVGAGITAALSAKTVVDTNATSEITTARLVASAYPTSKALLDEMQATHLDTLQGLKSVIEVQGATNKVLSEMNGLLNVLGTAAATVQDTGRTDTTERQ